MRIWSRSIVLLADIRLFEVVFTGCCRRVGAVLSACFGRVIPVFPTGRDETLTPWFGWRYSGCSSPNRAQREQKAEKHVDLVETETGSLWTASTANSVRDTRLPVMMRAVPMYDGILRIASRPKLI
jgi:hypothetical protein